VPEVRPYCLKPNWGWDQCVYPSDPCNKPPKLPVLLASGYAADVLAQHGADGEFELLAKPFRAAELLQHIANVMRGSHHQVRATGLSETAGAGNASV
jgi:DNA-binding NtrC family response regulator